MKAYLTRDMTGTLYLSRISHKPTKGKTVWYGYVFMQLTDSDLPEGVNPQWSDDEPIEINLKLERVSK